MHGAGGGAPKRNKNALKHGEFTAEALAGSTSDARVGHLRQLFEARGCRRWAFLRWRICANAIGVLLAQRTRHALFLGRGPHEGQNITPRGFRSMANALALIAIETTPRKALSPASRGA